MKNIDPQEQNWLRRRSIFYIRIDKAASTFQKRHKQLKETSLNLKNRVSTFGESIFMSKMDQCSFKANNGH